MHSIHPIEMNNFSIYVIVSLVVDHTNGVIRVERWEVRTFEIDRSNKQIKLMVDQVQTNDELTKVNQFKWLKDFDSVPKIDGVEMFLVFDTLAKADTYIAYLHDLYKAFNLVQLPWNVALAHLKTAFYRKTQAFQADETKTSS